MIGRWVQGMWKRMWQRYDRVYHCDAASPSHEDVQQMMAEIEERQEVVRRRLEALGLDGENQGQVWRRQKR